MSDAIAASYDRWSRSYDTDQNATRDLDAHIVRTADLPVTGAAVLELGCGTGKNTSWLAEHARSVVAMDFSEGMLSRARTRVTAAHVDFLRHDITQPWPLPDAAFDVVVGNLVLEHVASLAPVFVEAARVLCPGGTLFCCELHPFRQWRGGQAHFSEADTGTVVQIPAFVHGASDYINDGIAAGLTLTHLGEWLEAGAPPAASPRLLSVRFRRP